MADYIADGKPDFYSTNTKYLEWKTTSPTEPGWYWVSYLHPHGDGKRFQFIKYINERLEYHEALPWDSEGEMRSIKFFNKDYPGAYWLGPLPAPEPPTESE
jgi:hypothetical protein